MFTVDQREALRADLVQRARQDERITAAALVGSGATGREDDYSDIDLALRLAPDAPVELVAENWTAAMYAEHGAVDHLDVWFQDTLFRVFLLADSLQIDLSFWPDGDFRSTEPGFTLLFGEQNPPTRSEPPDVGPIIAMAWLHALHARSAVARGRTWQAVLMLDGVRDRIITLACLRHGLNGYQGRGADQLPAEITQRLARIRPGDPDPAELRRCLRASVEFLTEEVRAHDTGLAARLGPTLDLLGGVPPTPAEQ